MITQPAPTMRASADADPRPEALDAAAARRRAGDGDASDVVLDGLWRRLGDVQALAGMSLTVPAGTLVALLGPSGCGKTTALRVLAGLEDLDAGAVRIAGRDVSHVPAHRRDNAMVFQAFSLMPHMTAGENVAFALELRGVPRRARAAIVDEHLELVGLGSHRDRYAHQLSGGQQQRVALARALAVRPSVLLLDEPLSALDAKVRVSLRDEIRRIQSQTGITTLFVTHDQEEALEVADEIVVINEGRVEQVGSPDDLYDTPANQFVMGFLGPVTTLGDRLVRPHDVHVFTEPPAGLATVEGRVVRALRVGFEVRLEVETAGSRTEVTLTRAEQRALGASGGSTVWLRPAPDARTLTLV